ncbi:MAG: T9SS type A sorting domain-containing protein [Flavobacteriales bacterium]|nr:T9SS type A sorting domain-containing protein [Flavobacteriales bacterium]
MKKTVLYSLVLFALYSISNNLGATEFTEISASYDHLCEINKQWQKHTKPSSNQKINFNTDIDRIQFHLRTVRTYLINNTPEGFSKESLTIRNTLLGELRCYAERKIFPTNNCHSNRQPYFIDSKGVHCAVGYLIAASGNEKLAQRISNEHNYDYIENITTSGLLQWAAVSGFTVEELKLIQPNYAASYEIDSISNGTNGPVSRLYSTTRDNKLIIAGNFSELDNLPCNNIGMFKDEQLSCLGNGINGLIKDVNTDQYVTLVAGELENDGKTYPMATYDDGNWNFLEIPNREGAVGTACHPGIYGSDFWEIAITHDSIPGLQEVWYLNDNDVWVKKITVNGSINVISDHTSWYTSIIYAGNFTTVTVHLSSSVDTILSTNNLLMYEPYNVEFTTFGNQISDTVNVVKSFGNSLYIGGTCVEDSFGSNVCLAEYINGMLQPLIFNDGIGTFITGSASFKRINDIDYIGGADLILSGNFQVNSMMLSGTHLTTYDMVYHELHPWVSLDSEVLGTAIYEGDLYLGGNFSKSVSGMWLHGYDNPAYFGRITTFVSIEENNTNHKVSIYPNPITNIATVSGLNSEIIYNVYNLSGSLVLEGTANGNSINLSQLSNNAYILKLKSDKGIYKFKFIKE